MDAKDTNPKPEKDEIDDILEKALEGVDDKLNLTADESVDEEKLAPELEKEYEEFMKSLNKDGVMGDDAGMNEFSNLMANLLSGLKNDPDLAKNGKAGEGASNPDKGASEDELKNVFSKLLGGNQKDGNFDDIAQKLLKEFMDKEILLEPLQEAEKNYTQYLQEKKKGSTVSETDKKNFEAQLDCIKELLIILQTNPTDKDKMINIFEKMHDYGSPPEGILNPLSNIPGMPMPDGNPSTAGMQQPEMDAMMGNFEKMMSGPNAENCNIF